MLEHADQKKGGHGWQAASVLPGSDIPLWRLLESLPAGAYTCDIDGLITYFNPHAMQLWGRTPKLRDPVDRFCGSFRLFLPDGSPIAHDQCWMALALKTGTAYNGCEIVVERPNGQHFTVLAHATPIFDEAGSLLGAVNVLVDITERKQVEQARKESEERLRLALDAGEMGTWEVDLYSGEAWIDAQEALLLGLPPRAQHLRVQDFLALVHPDDRNEVRRQQALARKGWDFRAEFRLLRPDGQVRWLVGQGSTSCDAAGRPRRVVGINYDITERKEAEDARLTLNTMLEQRVAKRTAALKQAHDNLRHEVAERERMQEALFQQEKLAALGTLLANVAHELNNPLAVATMQLDNLQEEGGAGTWSEDLELLRQAVERCQSVVQSFLALARQQAPERRTVALHTVVDDVLVLLGRALEGDGISVESHLAEDLPPLWADAHQLHHVLANLITNAHHALRQTDPPWRLCLTAAATADRRQVKLEVTDSGPGMPQDVQRRVFDPFFTTKPQGEGSGLGLPLCRSIVEGHGGTMHLASQSGRGTTVSVILPAATSDVGTPQRAVEPIEPGQTPGGQVLLIDDEASMQRALRRLLERDGHDVTTAANGMEGLAALDERSYEVILCDMRMPDLDGPGFYRELERCYPHLLSRVVFLTGDVLGPEAQAFFAQVDRPRLEKPFRVQQVRRVIQQVLEAR